MRIQIFLETEYEKTTELAIANAIVEMCKDTYISKLNPKIIAKAILLQVESEDTE